MWNILFDWGAALALGTDVVVYLVMALIGTTFFVLRILTALFFGDTGGDVDFDTGMDAASHTDASFSFFSLLSILAFFMGAGWMGLTCRVDWSMGSFTSAMAASGFGFGMMLLASGLMAVARKLNQTIEYDLNTALGKTARVYMTIPPKGEGRGQIEVSVSGRRKIIDAISSGDKISEFQTVKVIEIRDDGAMVVQPAE